MLNRFPQNFPNGFLQKKSSKFSKLTSAKTVKWISAKKKLKNSAKISKWIFNIFGWARRAPLLGSNCPTVAAKGCSPTQDLEKTAQRV